MSKQLPLDDSQYRPIFPDSPFIHIADLVNQETGLTYREENAKITHNIPIGALVELDTGIRLFVVYHARDCDQTPLYSLAANKDDTVRQDETGRFANSSWDIGHPEYSLTVIKATRQDYRLSSYGYKRRALLSHLKNINEYITRIAQDLEWGHNPDYLIAELRRQSNKIITLMEGKYNE